MKESDCNKTIFVTSISSCVYLRIDQKLKGALPTYSQFSDLVFCPFLATKDKSIPQQDTIIGTKEKLRIFYLQR